MRDIGFFLKVSRPRFWIYLLGPFIIGLIAGVSDKADLLDWRFLIFGLYFTLPANLLVYGINDIFDFETDKLNPKKADYESLVTPAKWSPLGIAIALLNFPFIFLAAISVRNGIAAVAVFILLSIGYSAPPIRAKAKPFLDSAFNVLYIMPGVFAYIMAAKTLPPVTLILAAGLWTAAMHAFSAIPDIGADREAGLHTIATTLGPTGTHIFCLAAYIGSSVLAYQYIETPAFLIGLLYVGMITNSIVSKDKDSIFQVYRRFPLVNAGVGLAIFWYVAITKFY